MKAGETWECVRYRLENKVFQSKKTPETKVISYIEGHRCLDFSAKINLKNEEIFPKLQDHDILTENDFIYLRLRPIYWRTKFSKVYLPKSMSDPDLQNKVQFLECVASEDEKMKQLLENQQKAMRPIRKSKNAQERPNEHPSKTNGEIPSWYKCYKCGGAHNISECTKNSPNVRSHLGSGIPASQLRPATDSEKANARNLWETKDGVLCVHVLPNF